MSDIELSVIKIPVNQLSSTDMHSLATWIDGGYDGKDPSKVKLTGRNKQAALAGISHARHVLIGHEDGRPTAVLGSSIYTREQDPEFFSAIERRIQGLDESIRADVFAAFGELDAVAGVDEMVAIQKGGRRVQRLHRYAVRSEGIDPEAARIAHVGEFQSPLSFKVLRRIPESVAILAGEYIPQRGQEVSVSEEQLVVLRTLAHVIGETFLAKHPKAKIYNGGVVRSAVFDGPPPVIGDELDGPMRRAMEKIHGFQRKLNRSILRRGNASAIGVAFTHVV